MICLLLIYFYSYTMPIKEFAVLLLTFSTSFCAYPGVPSKIAELIYNWAPLVKLAEKEEFRPSSVDYFLRQTKMEGCSSQPKPTRLTVYNLQRCNGNSYLTTKQSISCPSCTDPTVFRGQDPSDVPVYVIYREQNNFLDIAYWLFFPYNRGKRACIGRFVWGRCVGKYSTFGHHVGDWEKVIVRFRKVNTDYQIYSIYLSTHSQKITKKYVGEFLWQGGKFKKGSRTLDMYGGTHAIVYSAKGSHGIWPNSGKHKYKKIQVTGQWLQDECSSGTSWHTWNKLKPVRYDPNGRYKGEFKFMGFQGHWGNKKRGCGRWGLIKKILTTCMLDDGPRGPSRFPQFG